MLIAHLSDPHLRARGELYQGIVDSNALFDRALDTLTALDPAPDMVIIGGDLTDEATPAEYATVTEKLARLDMPVHAIPGNHDTREGFRRAFAGAGHLPETGPLHFCIEGPVRVIGFDVTVPDAHHGLVDDPAASWLDRTLAEAPDRPTLILMHQPPVDTGISCIDAYKCRGADLLAAVISRHPQVERLLCGHIHRHMQQAFAGTQLICAPSTATAIALRLDPGAPGASWLEPPAMLLHDARRPGPIVTHYLPIGRFDGPYDFF